MKSLKAILYLFACIILVSGIVACGGGGSGGDNPDIDHTEMASRKEEEN